MENKKKETKEKIKLNDQNIFTFLLSFLILIYFFYGFFTDENSAGAGGYSADFKLIWKNLELFKQNIIFNLNSAEYNDSRPPLSYILHIFFNPFTYNQEVFRLSNLLLSAIVPFLLFFTIKENYPKLSNDLIILLSLTVTLSPYFRTTAYWALGENYGIIFLLLSYITFSNFKKNLYNIGKGRQIFTVFLLCLFSSLVVYFDQKLVFLPLLILISILNLKITKNYKIFTLFLFFVFSLPYFYLIQIWGAIIPPSAFEARGVGTSIHLFNPGYCLTILVIVSFPFIIVNKMNLIDFKNKIFNQRLFYALLLFLIYLASILIFGDFESLQKEGKGAFHKLSLIFFQNNESRYMFTLLVFFISTIIIFIIFNDFTDLLIINYFLILSLFTFPFYQEYLDPLIYILIFSFFKSRFLIKSKSDVCMIVLYFFIFSLGAKYYYAVTI